MSSGKSPSVTVLLPVYNGERYLEAAVQSVLSQTYADFELLVVDDGSTDSTHEILSRFTDSRIRLLRNGSNLKLIGTLNRGVQEARGRWIARMDADDLSFRSRLRTQIHWLESHPDVDVLGTAAVKINEKGRPTGYLAKPSGDLKAWAWIPTPLVHPTVVMRRAVALKNPYAPEAVHCEDYELWMRLAKAGHRIRNLRRPLLYYRIHPQNVTSQQRGLQLRTCFEAFKRHYAVRGLTFDEYLGMITPQRRIPLRRRKEILRDLSDSLPWGLRSYESLMHLRSLKGPR